MVVVAGAARSSPQDAAAGDSYQQRVSGTGITVAMVFVPAGEFELGSPDAEPGRDPDEGPLRRVSLSAFWMAAHEVTHDEFAAFRYRRLDDSVGPADDVPFDADAVTRPSPPYEDPAHGMGKGDHPAVGMTRWAALQYARWLSDKTGRLYRLPTEAEWEYACEAGAGSAFGFGDDPAAATEYAWLAADGGDSHHAVATKLPNSWGLHDLHGNVAEWVLDSYDENSYAREPEVEVLVDPMPELPVRGRGVVRGGAFDDEPARARCAERFPEAAAWKRRDPQIPKSRWWNTDSPHVGFRLVSPARTYTRQQIREYWSEVLGE